MREFILNILKGIIIGIANIVPGISGASLAFILGIYQKIIDITTKFDFNLIKLILNRQFKTAKNYISFNFLIAISIGIIISFMIFAKLLDYLFLEFQSFTWSYFFGIIAASIFYIVKFTSSWKVKEWISFLIGFFLSVLTLFLEPGQQNTDILFIFFCGIVGSVGMITPGLSGSYLLILLGNYKLILIDTINQLSTFNFSQDYFNHIKILFIFLLGQTLGLLMFSRLIKWLIDSYKNITFSLISGFITGSLTYIWPWQNNNPNEILINRIQFPTLSINDLYSILFILIGIISIVIIEYAAKNSDNV